MARELRWQIPFKSLSEKTCWVYIYVEGWTGGVSTLTGAADPFVFDEDDSDDLLDAVRQKTGYLRVIEENYGDLEDMHPLTNTDHFVRVLYDGLSVFTGFMQAQSFETKLEPGPRVLEFPVTSPLGITDGLHFTAPSNPSYITLASALKQVATILNASINYIIFPDYILSESQRQLSWQMNTLSICPFNDDYDNNKYSSEELYKPKTLHDFIESLCNCFGLIVHDLPDTLVFSRFDYDGSYNRYTVSSMDNETPTFTTLTTGETLLDLSSLPVLSNEGKEKTILPVRKVELNFDDDFLPDYSPNFKHAKANYSGVGYVILTPTTDEITSNYLLTTALPTVGSNKLAMCAAGKLDYYESLSEMFMFSFSAGTSSATQILKWKLYNIPKYSGYGCKFSFSVDFINSTTREAEGASGVTVGVIMKNGLYYRQSNGTWTITSAQYIENVVTDENGNGNIEFFQAMPDWSSPLEVIFCVGTMTGDAIFAIKDISFNRTAFSFLTYSGQTLKDKHPIIVDNGSNADASVSQTINVYRQSEDCLLASGSGSGVTYGTLACEYEYMFETQPKVTIDTFMAISTLSTLYLKKTTIGDSTNKRVVAYGFDLWNDKMTISAQGSSTI